MQQIFCQNRSFAQVLVLVFTLFHFCQNLLSFCIIRLSTYLHRLCVANCLAFLSSNLYARFAHIILLNSSPTLCFPACNHILCFLLEFVFAFSSSILNDILLTPLFFGAQHQIVQSCNTLII